MALAKLKEKSLSDSWTVEEYLEFERISPVRHEYVDGQLYAMSGESKNHNRLAGKLYLELSLHLADGECEAFIENVKVKVSSSLYYYPDVIVSCSEPAEDENAYIIEDPILIVEVLSPTTTRNDRVEKMNAYQKLPSLHEYIIISQDFPRVEIYRHSAAGAPWQREMLENLEAEVFLQSVGLKIELAGIYRRVRWAAETEERQEN
ncbi:MAG TPA: Uma2 family endonuclease [Blastocatellia bacterium]|nr:Uma2 family endonuclease [Blastocatellia bacterium]HMX27392.1 Uma2 family endonuclease [Blastocatellia bacterium]HMZ20834.1 Uma2 family endonuclease [Blastocatellia bacterium]HNG29036.1 Uma2 family endonuclease [Blastocatellia bacterium]